MIGRLSFEFGPAKAIKAKSNIHLNMLKLNVMTKKVFKYKYDFEIGYLIKSPCKKCIYQKTLPKCSDRCEILDKIHAVLAESVSCSRRKY